VFYVLGVAGVRFRDVVGQAGEAALVQGEVFNSVFSAQAPKLYNFIHRQPAVQYQVVVGADAAPVLCPVCDVDVARWLQAAFFPAVVYALDVVLE